MSNLKNISKSEFVTGAVAAAAFLPWYVGIGLAWSAIVIALAASLWAIGGTLNKAYRRIGVPALILAAVLAAQNAGLMGWSWTFLGAFFIMFGAASLGYGTPSTQPPDPGSKIGAFWWRALDGKRGGVLASAATRSTIGIIFGAAGLCLGGAWWWLPLVACPIGFCGAWAALDR